MYRDIPRDVPWPGNQINDINQFRDECYRRCHEQNPTDSGWYEKVNACGQQCKYALQAYEYMQGKNPCELRLQAPVFWFQSNPTTTYESYQFPMRSNDEDGDFVIAPSTPTSLADVRAMTEPSTSSKEWSWTDIFYMLVAILLILVVCMYILYLWRTPTHPRSNRRR